MCVPLKCQNSSSRYDEVLDPPTDEELAAHNALVKHPYNDSVAFPTARTWLRDDWLLPGAVSPRSVNWEFAQASGLDLVPKEFVWEEGDFAKLDALS